MEHLRFYIGQQGIEMKIKTFIIFSMATLILSCQDANVEKFESLKSFEAFLRPGMTKSEIAVLLGSPYNTDNVDIWMWSEHGYRADWKQMTRKENCLFIVFESGKLKHTEIFSANDISPAEILKRPVPPVSKISATPTTR